MFISLVSLPPNLSNYKSQTHYVFIAKAWADITYWQRSNDRKTLERINKLIKNIKQSSFSGIGKPEQLKHHLTGFWSRRINNQDRIIYTVSGKKIIVMSCRGHYEF